MTAIAVGVLWFYRGALVPAPAARARGSAVHVLHVVERDVVAGEDANRETPSQAGALLDASIAELRESGMPCRARSCAASAPTPTSPTRSCAARPPSAQARSSSARTGTRPGCRPASPRASRAHAPAHVIVVNPRAGALGRPLAGGAASADPALIWDGSSAGR